jgi:hypothetical protein
MKTNKPFCLSISWLRFLHHPHPNLFACALTSPATSCAPHLPSMEVVGTHAQGLKIHRGEKIWTWLNLNFISNFG